jgi:hypothetical protein
MKRWIRLALPWAIIGAGTAVLAGCIYIPGSYQRVNANGAPRPEARIGEPGTDKPLQRGRSMRDEVVRVLGQPDETVGDGASVYEYRVNTGWLVALCGGIDPFTDSRFLRVDFDEDGRLRGYKVFKDKYEAMGAKS